MAVSQWRVQHLHARYLKRRTKPPVAAFSASPRPGKAPLKAQFTGKRANTVSLTVKSAKGSSTKTMSGYIVGKMKFCDEKVIIKSG